MPKLVTTLLISTIVLLHFSCKNETADSSEVVNTSSTLDTIQKVPVKRAPKKVLTPEDHALLKSVMSRVMTEPQLKRWASYLVTAQLTDLLANQAGPFTVFGPSNSAFELFPSELRKFYSNPENAEALSKMLKSHIVEGNYEREFLVEKIKKSGKLKLKTLAGTTLTASLNGDAIILAEAKGIGPKILKGSIEASNGSVYVIDSVLGIP